MPLWKYIVCFVYPGTSAMLVRSFAEHRADAVVPRRTAVVESAGPFALLFLFNNLHAAHHRWPAVAWYRLPALYAAHRTEIADANGGLVYNGYREMFARFLLRRHDDPVHPGRTWR